MCIEEKRRLIHKCVVSLFFLTLVLIASSFWQEPRFGLGASHLALSRSVWVGLYQHPSSGGARAKGLSQSVGGIALVPRLERKEEKKIST